MRCPDIRELIDMYVDDALPVESRAAVERHVLRCAECASQVKALEQTRALVAEAFPRAEASPAFRERMAARLEDAFRDVLRPAGTPAPDQRSLPFPS